jgi:hypothetical protein
VDSLCETKPIPDGAGSAGAWGTRGDGAKQTQFRRADRPQAGGPIVRNKPNLAGMGNVAPGVVKNAQNEPNLLEQL